MDHPNWYSLTKQQALIFRMTHNRPDAMVTVYRSVPVSVDKINPGDWVSPFKYYAEMTPTAGEEHKVISMKVRAGDLYTAGEPEEWGWHPQTVQKGRKAQQGDVRTWKDGRKMKKVGTEWVPVETAGKKKKAGKKAPPPGSQLPPKTLEKLKKMGITKFPAGDIPKSEVKVDFSDPLNKAVMKWVDGSGTPQSAYTPEFHDKNADVKWQRVSEARKDLPKFKKDLKKKLAEAKDGSVQEQGILAAAIIAYTALRPGSKRSLDKFGNYGVTTMTSEHIKVSGNTVTINFTGKAGKGNKSKFTDKAIADALKRYIKTGRNAKKSIFKPSSLNEARKAAKPLGVKLKDFRTIIACNIGLAVLNRQMVPPPLTGNAKKDKRLLAKAMLQASKIVAKALNNTPAVARDNYVHPEIFKEWAVNKAKADPKLFEEAKKK
jgi:DNA topoisomerase-1